jgi:hypothetical protein
VFITREEEEMGRSEAQVEGGEVQWRWVGHTYIKVGEEERG